jgi:hypothetical protein
MRKIIIAAAAALVPLNDGSEEPFRCEAHPERELGVHPKVQEGTAHEGDETPPWLIYVTPDGWTIGDEKILVALCPECTAAQWEIERG